jgi:hypothetical protein
LDLQTSAARHNKEKKLDPTNLYMNYGLNKTGNLYGKGAIFYGDSFTTSSTLGRYSTIIASYLYGPHTNHGVNGQQVRAASNVAVSKPTGRTQTMIIMSGLNDLLQKGGGSLNCIVNNIRAMIVTGLLKNQSLASAMSAVGTWSNGNTVMGDRSYALGSFSKFTTQGPGTAYREWTFDGDNVVVGSMCAGTGAYKDVDVWVDGVQQSPLINVGSTNDQYGHTAKLYKGFGAGSHTVRVQSVLAGGPTMVDYVGTLVDPADAVPIVVCHVPYVHSTNSYGLTNATVDNVNNAIDAMVAEFSDWPVVVARTNDYYTAQSECLPDDIHPKHILTSPAGPGMQHIAEAILEHFTHQ